MTGSSEIYQHIIEHMTWLEAFAVLFGLLSVWYARKEHIWVFPTGIVSTLIYVYICLGAGLYADMGINAYYFVMSLYGWYTWTQGSGKRKQIPVQFNSPKENLISIGLSILYFLILRFILDTYTDSDVPVLDALTTSIFLTGMLLMARKKIENWIAWIIGDLISIPLYIYKGLYLTAFQFAVFLVIAILGYISWKASLESEKKLENA